MAPSCANVKLGRWQYGGAGEGNGGGEGGAGWTLLVESAGRGSSETLLRVCSGAGHTNKGKGTYQICARFMSSHISSLTSSHPLHPHPPGPAQNSPHYPASSLLPYPRRTRPPAGSSSGVCVRLYLSFCLYLGLVLCIRVWVWVRVGLVQRQPQMMYRARGSTRK